LLVNVEEATTKYMWTIARNQQPNITY